jgi:pimeloyl-ACP methyl ester carboxylesterase
MRLAQVTSQFCSSSDGVRLAYRVLYPKLPSLRSNVPVVCVMGLSATKEDGLTLANALCQDRPVLVFDNRGIGESDIPSPAHLRDVTPHPQNAFSAAVTSSSKVPICSIDDMASDIFNITSHVGWTRFHLLGHSMGGMICLGCASAVPPQVSIASLSLLGSTPGGKDAAPPSASFLASLDSRKAVLSKSLGGLGMTVQQYVRSVHEYMFTPEWIANNSQVFADICDDILKYKRSPRGVAMQAAAAGQFDLALLRMQAVRRVRTLIVHGSDDRVVPPSNAHLLASRLGDPPHQTPELRMLHGVGHSIWHMDDGQAQMYIRDFLHRADTAHG